MKALATELGISEYTVQYWRSHWGERHQRGVQLRRVEVIAERPLSSRAVTVHGPAGTRIEGLQLDEVAELWRKLAMLGALRGVSVWAYGEPCDMRKSFNTLQALVEREMKRELATGDLFVFVPKNRKRAKVLYFDGTGLCLFASGWRREDLPRPGRGR